MVAKPEESLTHARLVQAFSYDPETGIFRYKIVRTYHHKVGAIAGYKDPLGYVILRLDGLAYGAHRLAWFYVYGEPPRNNIDHANGICDDNRICNLRDATQSQNLCNKRIQSNNTSGYKGVTWHKGAQKWMAAAAFKKKQYYFGLYDTALEAYLARCAEVERLHGEFARHA